MDYSPAILEKDGSVTQPNGQTHGSASGSSTPAGQPNGTKASSTTLPPRGDAGATTKSSYNVKVGLAQMLKGGVIMDVMSVEQARIAEEAGACAVMVLEKIPSLIRQHGGVARTSDPALIKAVQEAVSIPVMAKVRVGHFAEAQILQYLGVDYIDESEVLTVADEQNHILKHNFNAPFVCGAKNLGEALRRISEGAAFIRSKGEPGTGNVVEAVRHVRQIANEIKRASVLTDEELYTLAKEISAPYHLLKETARLKRLPVVNFAAGGVASPADCSLLMQLGCDGIFVGSGIFLAEDPLKMAKACVMATTHYNNPKILTEVSTGLGAGMPGVSIEDTMPGGRMANVST